jgi:hypothetical protein
MRTPFTLALIAAGLALWTGTASGQITVGFDDLPYPPALDSATGLADTTGTGSLYDGVIWDSRVEVVGKDASINGGDPLFGVPHSGNYYITNNTDDGGNGITLQTSLVLTGAWFSRNKYYSDDSYGAEAVTIYALAGTTELGSIQATLPVDHSPVFIDTSVFLEFSGITGYRIDHDDDPLRYPTNTNWIADDFQFTAATTVPEPGSAPIGLGLAAAGFGLWVRVRSRQNLT